MYFVNSVNSMFISGIYLKEYVTFFNPLQSCFLILTSKFSCLSLVSVLKACFLSSYDIAESHFVRYFWLWHFKNSAEPVDGFSLLLIFTSVNKVYFHLAMQILIKKKI